MSVQPTSCYDYIIGLYNGDCDCYDGRPADYDESDSGLYLSDMFEPAVINSLLNCDYGASIWELMGIVRNYAIKLFIADTNALLMKYNKLRRLPFYGGIGRAKWSANKTLTNGYYAGVRMYAADIVSGYLRIKKIGTLFNTTGVITLYVYNNLGILVDTINLNTTADTHVQNTLATTLELPLHDDYLDNLEYFFIYEADGVTHPKNNDLLCNCEKWVPCFDTQNPYWYQTHSNKKNGWAKYLMVGGTYTNGLPDLMNSSHTTSNYMYGLTFEVELGCMVGEVLCKDELDYDGNTLAQAMAVAIQKKAAALFVDKILSSTNLNRVIMLNREEKLREKTEWEEAYGAMVNYVAENANIEANDCLECKELIEMTKTPILV